MKHFKLRSYLCWVLGAVAVVFGIATIISGGRVLFGDALIRAESGDVVLFVLVFNFIAGFAYVAAGVVAILEKRWSVHLAVFLTTATQLVFLVFGVHIAAGGAFERRTVVAMIVRCVFWLVEAAILGLIFKHKPGEVPDRSTNQSRGDA